MKISLLNTYSIENKKSSKIQLKQKYIRKVIQVIPGYLINFSLEHINKEQIKSSLLKFLFQKSQLDFIKKQIVTIMFFYGTQE
ncbi:unnamed protein product [Paramecium sonneborni]|uniref:Uncharacterized protein n=1 Tax=Paramecium sonneborni TaxID=65129 RepID=A0A8S1RSI1_9CILI|nr:unnamed protein product [Paramecium sonneborni]